MSLSMVTGLVLLSVFGSTVSNGVDDGAPLTLYMIRLPTDDVNHLSLYPEDNIRVRENSSYRVMLGQEGSGQDSITILYPPVKEDNKLQYETNISIDAHYDLNIFARPPQDLSDLEYRIEVLIELDHTRDGDYEDEIRFQVTGEASNMDPEEPTNIVGQIPVDINKLGDLRGGRMRVTLTRLDDIDTPVWLYTGYLGKQCMIRLPYSKFVYVEEDESGDVNWAPFLVGAIIVIVVVVGYILYQNKQKEDETVIEEPGKRGPRRGRR
ncbi:MAG: hypothetical protein KAH57_08025 [Thermoplasmata archaeon]|nr:hypothetical protein [Thermoplasmata archaeon]